jgi:cytochrome c-type biogenesis protein CcmH/NrfG
VFVLLAVVFAGSFIFLGVGSGSGSGLGDVFSNIFTGGGGPSIDKLQAKVDKNPKDAAALLQLGQALQGKQRTDEAIVAYERYVTLRPKNVTAMQQLASLYNLKAQSQYNVAAAAQEAAQSADPGQTFGPAPGSKFGQALGSDPSSLGGAASSQASQAFQSAVGQYQSTLQQLVGVYQKIAKATPDDSGALINVGRAAGAAGETGAAVAAFKTFLKKFPDDPLAPDVRNQLKQLQTSAKG